MDEGTPLHLKSCCFCRILAGKAEGSFVFRDGRVAAFMDITPVTPGHLLVIPIRHAVYLSDLDPADGARMFEVAQNLVAALREFAKAGTVSGRPENEGHLRGLKTGDSPSERRVEPAAVQSPFSAEGVNLFLADGEQAGQEVPHVHLHVIPRYRGDGFTLKLPPGYGHHPARSELDRIAAAIKAGLSAD